MYIALMLHCLVDGTSDDISKSTGRRLSAELIDTWSSSDCAKKDEASASRIPARRLASVVGFTASLS